MPNPRLIQLGLVGLSYILLLATLATGVLQLVQKNSAALKTAHRWAAIPTLALFTLAQVAIIVVERERWLMRLFAFLLFVEMTYGAAFTGWVSKPGARKALHVAFGGVAFLMFTYFIFRFLLAGA